MAHWQVLAGDGAPDAQLTEARDRKVTFRLTDPATFDFTMDGRHPQAGHVHELVTDVHLARDGVIVYTGRVGGTQDQIQDGQHALTVSTADYRGLLGRAMWHDALRVWSADQATIVRGLIDHMQGFPGGNLGIDTALPLTGTTVTRKVETGARILPEIQALASGGDKDSPAAVGFDWDISAGWTGRALQLWRKRGTDRGTALTYRYTGRSESSIVASLQRQVDPATYANAIQVSGSDQLVAVPGTGSPGYYDEWGDWVPPVLPDQTPATRPIWRVVDDIATRPEGRWESQLAFPDQYTQDMLEAKADAELARLQRLAPTYSVTLKQGAWEGPEHIWLGDPVRLVVVSGRVLEDVTLRVSEIAVTLGESGEEDVQLTIGEAPGSLLSRMRETEHRLAVATQWRQG